MSRTNDDTSQYVQRVRHSKLVNLESPTTTCIS